MNILLEFFDLVDIDGDGSMQWSEFVMFVIELVVKEEISSILEELALVNRHPIQPPGSQSVVTCCKYIPELNKICLGVGNELQLYDGVENSPTWLSEGAKLKLKRKPLINDFNPNSSSHYVTTKSSADKKEAVISISDLIFIDSKDMMAVLRSDLCIEFFRFTSRTVASADLIVSFGFHFLPRPYLRLDCRDRSKEILLLFGVSSQKDIDCWEVVVGKIGPVKLENHVLLKQHTDFVRDIVVINNDSYSLFATGGMDRVVYIWDLDTLKHKATRTGFSAGVQCVAFDGKSILLAGSFDFQIIGWDLDAHINKPVFCLWGHNSCISKIVSFGAYNRCFSLDKSGVINMWDTSKTSSTDKEGRLIDTIHYVEDHAYCFTVMQKNISQFPTLNGLILVAQGRHQHVYKVKDNSTKLSVPIIVLYSLPLQMVITVHTKDVVFWSAINGEERNRITNITTSEVLCATLDNRCRKLIVGTSNGIITIFNCLKAAKIKSFPPLQAAIRFLLYSPDKTIICISGVGDMHIVDDLVPEDKLADSVMRECRAHESDVVSIAYSYQLGLIATADCAGHVVVWDYQFMSAEIILTEALAAEVGQVVFMDPYPFLLLCDNFNCFTVIPVGPAAISLGKKHWKVSPVVHRAPHKHKHDHNHDHAEGATSMHQSFDDHASSHSAIDDSQAASDSHAHQHVMSTKRMRKFLEEKNDLKCVTIDHNYSELVGDSFELTAELLIANTESLEVDAETLVERWDSKTAEKLIVPNNFRFIVFTGHEDGTISSFDFAKALKDINFPALQLFETAPRKKGYDPRKITVFRKLRSADYIRAAYSETDVSDGELLSSCLILHVWHAHKGVFHSMQVIGDEHLLLTVGEDCCVHLFSQVGVLKAVLTRGQEVDMKLKPRWINPIDMVAREVQRMKESKRLIKLLSLKRTVNVNKEVIDPFSDDILAIRRALKSRSNQPDSEHHATSHEAVSKEQSFVEDSPLSNSSPQKSSNKRNKAASSSNKLSMTKYNPHHPPRELLIGQLRGEITYELSSKDYAHLVITHKLEEANKLKIRAKNSNILADKTPGTTYLNELLKDSTVGGPVKLTLGNAGKSDKTSIYLTRNSQPFAHKSGKTKVKSKYDLESEQIELSDPMNWDIKSVNRQRSLYGKLYDEMARSQLTKDPQQVMVAKLNALSPNGDFATFAEKIKSQRKAAKVAITQAVLLSTSAPSLLPTQTLPRDQLNQDIVIAQLSAVLSSSVSTEKSAGDVALPLGKDFNAIMKSHTHANSEQAIEALKLSLDIDEPNIKSGDGLGRVPSRSPVVPNPTRSKDRGIFKVSHLSSPRMEPLEDLHSPGSPQPLPGVKTPRFSCKADLKRYLGEKEKTLDLLRSFDSKVEVVEKVYRKAKKQTKTHLKTLNKVSKTPDIPLMSSIPISKPLSPGSLISSPGQTTSVGKLHALRRHSSAQVLIRKQTSMDGLVEVDWHISDFSNSYISFLITL